MGDWKAEELESVRSRIDDLTERKRKIDEEIDGLCERRLELLREFKNGDTITWNEVRGTETREITGTVTGATYWVGEDLKYAVTPTLTDGTPGRTRTVYPYNSPRRAAASDSCGTTTAS